MAAIFALTFSTLGAFLSDGVGMLIDDGLAPLVRAALAPAPAWFTSLVCDGIIKGVGGVLTFCRRSLCCSSAFPFWRTAAT